jgi:hypothetical protein
MLRRRLALTVVIGLLAAPAFAQGKVEASAFYGYTVSDGVSVPATTINGASYTRADPRDSRSFGFTFGFYVTPQAEIEFLWSRQSSKLDVTGTGPKLSGDMNIGSYHVNFVYNFGEPKTVARPFVFIGVGATDYGDAAFPAKTVPGMTRFSWTLGGGIKAYPSRHVGFRAMARVVPTYIKTGGYGWWCDPYWGCTVVGNAQYSNQFEFSGGLTLRF